MAVDGRAAPTRDGTPPAGWDRAARGLFWLLALGIVTLALWPRMTLPEPAATQGATQYFHHVGAYLVLMLVGAAAWGLRDTLVIGVTLGAIGLELAQTLSPGRQTAVVDMVASLAGVAFGYGLTRLALRALERCQGLPPRAGVRSGDGAAAERRPQHEREGHGAPL